jgi:cadmium resistance protein CadD (predicted permease)
MLTAVGLAIVLFASTNIDDIFLLLGFFADSNVRPRQVVIGQYLGISALVAASILASLISLVLAPAYVGLLGIIPILFGIKNLLNLRKPARNGDRDVSKAGLGNILAVAAVTAAHGGDNIGVYTPIFATKTSLQVAVMVSVFSLMVALWLVVAHWLVHHRSLGAPIRRFGHIVVPFVLIGIGFYILYEAGSLSLLH